MNFQLKKPLAKGLVTTTDSSYSKSIEQIQQEAALAVAKYSSATLLASEYGSKVISIKSFEQSAVLQKASELKPKPINWIWGGWIAGGKFHLLGGVAGTGKTTISLALVSSITTGGFFPDGSKAPKGNVVVWTGEDDVCDTLTPRLMAMGADLDKVHFIQGMKTGNEERPFDPSTDFLFLKDAIEKIGNVKVLIIDPIVSVVKGDSHKNAEVRKDLTPLVQMAEHLGFAIIGITHFSKGTSGREPIERITGSLAFGAVARVVLVASKTKNEDGDDIRIFLRAKSNIGIDEGGFEYSLESATTENGIETSRVLWGSLIEGSARELLGDAEEESDGGGIKGCMSLITDLLAYGEVAATQMEKDCKGAGYSFATMRRAKKQLGIDSQKRGMGSKGVWMWMPPKMLNISKDVHTHRVSTLGKSEHLNDLEIIEGEL
jgi:putative DNA primase/helicase